VERGSSSFERARHLTGQCRPRAARRACEAALKEDPGNARAVALRSRLDVALNRKSLDVARTELSELIEQHPHDSYLKVASALLASTTDRPTAIAELRVLAETNEDDPYVHQCLAGLLGCDKATWDAAWWHYKAALHVGPLMSPAYKAAAYSISKRIEPGMSRATLQGSGSIERASIRTRSLGLNRLGIALSVPLIPTFILFYAHQAGWGVVALAATSLAAGWITFSNVTAGCWRCVWFWLLTVAAIWGLVAWAHWSHSGDWRGWYVAGAGGLLIGLAIPTKAARTPSSKSRGAPPPPPSLVKGILGLVALGAIVFVFALVLAHVSSTSTAASSACPNAPALKGSVGTSDTRVEAVAMFKSGTTQAEVNRYDASFSLENTGCFAFAEFTPTASGRVIMDVRDIPSRLAYTQSHVIGSLKRSKLFSSVTK
jgi:hypothetical protein